MTVLLVNGSPHSNGNTARALEEIAGTLAAEGLGTETLWIGVKPVRGCIACGRCQSETPGRCAFDDDPANRIAEKMADADGLVLGAPVYYGQPAGQLLAVVQRVCFASGKSVAGKPVACVAVCRRGGATAAYQCMTMPFEMLECPAIRHLRKLGLEPSPHICLQTSEVNAGMCEGTPWESSLEILGEGHCVQCFKKVRGPRS